MLFTAHTAVITYVNHVCGAHSGAYLEWSTLQDITHYTCSKMLTVWSGAGGRCVGGAEKDRERERECVLCVCVVGGEGEGRLAGGFVQAHSWAGYILIISVG